MKFELPKLDSKTALAPIMSEETSSSVENIIRLTNTIKMSLEEIIVYSSKDKSKLEFSIMQPTSLMFWKCMKPRGGYNVIHL